MFCGCAALYGAPPNARTCPVCLGYPGALPVPNAEAVRLAVRAAAAFGCDVHASSEFARKNYHYPDLPKGYQITQYDRPLATGGAVEFETASGTQRVPLRRLHLEEDAGKSTHRDDVTELDFNRAGVPLVEIVTEPAIDSAAAAHDTMVAIRGILRHLGVCDGDMERGSLRCDANVSLRAAASGEPGTPVEIKNLNSFRHVRQALQHEIERQSGVLGAGGRVARETRLWDAADSRTRTMRGKEAEPDYRYFPEPDIPRLAIPDETIRAEREALPELPAARERRYVSRFGLPRDDAHRLAADREVAEYFEAVAGACEDPIAAARLVVNVPASDLAAVAPVEIAGLLRLIADGRVSRTTALREVLPRMYTSGRPAAEILHAEGFETLDDEDAITEIVRSVLQAHPDQVRSYHDGKAALIGFFVGQVVTASGGRIDPRTARAALRECLDR